MTAFVARWAVITLVASACILQSQETRGQIFGRISDPSSASVAGALVTVTNVDTNTSVRLESNSTGYYEANLLLPGNYQVSVEAAGFKKTVRSGLVLQVSSRLESDVELQVGSVTDSVAVTADAPLIETNSVSTGRVLDNHAIMDLPIQGGSVALLIKQSPGIQSGGVNNELGLHSNQGGSDYNVNGNVGGNSWSLDGTPNNGNGRRMAYLPVADTISEMKVETSNFDAAVGHTTGAVISMISKTGTNTYHGTGMWQHWQRRLNGSPFFVKQSYYRSIAAAEAAGDRALADRLRSQDKQPSGRANTYVGTFGGPVSIPKVYNGKDKLFFFVSYSKRQDIKTEEPSAINRTVPTLLERDGNFTELLKADPRRYQIYDPLSVRQDPNRAAGFFIRDAFAGNIIPKSRFQNPVYNAYVKLLPAPNNNGTNSENRNNYLAVGTPFNWDYKAFSERVDYNLTQKHRLFFRSSWNDFLEDRGDWTYETARGLHTNGLNRNNKGAAFDWTWTKSGTTIFDFALAANQFREGDRISVPTSFKPSDVGFPKYMDEKAGDQHILPFIDFDNAYQDIGRSGVPVYTRYRVFSGKFDVTHIMGKHTLRAGTESLQNFRTGGGGGNTSGNFQFRNTYTRKYSDTLEPAGDLGHQWAAFIMGMSNNMTISTNDSFALHNPAYGWYAQDTFRVNTKLTLTLGGRLEYERGQTERYNRLVGQFDPTAVLPISAAAQAAYASNPIPEISPANFKVLGGSTYLGVNGAPREAWPAELMFMPRLAAVYSLGHNTVLRAGYGLYFDTLNVMDQTDDNSQLNYSRTTSTPVTDSQQRWLVGDPLNGVPPLADPFPVRADGSRYDIPTRSALGLMAVAGQNFTFNGDQIKRARQQRWRVGIQRQLGQDLVFDVAYTGAYSDRINLRDTGSWYELNSIPQQYYAGGLARNDANATYLSQQVPNPFNIKYFESLKTTMPDVYADMATRTFFTNSTIARDRLIRPFPQMGTDVRATRMPLGETKIHGIEINVTKRFSKGYMFTLGYAGTRNRDRDYFANAFDRLPSWRVGNDGRPHRFIASGIYEFPFGRGRMLARSGWLSQIVGGWQSGVTYEYQPGPLLDFDNLFYYGDISAINTDGQTFDRWFNTSGCVATQAAAKPGDTVAPVGTPCASGFEKRTQMGPNGPHLRVFPRRLDNIRRDATNQWNVNLKRKIALREGLSMELQADALNIANRSQMDQPSRDPYSSTFGQITQQTSATNRFIQLQMRLVF